MNIIESHPVFGNKNLEQVTIYFEGQPFEAYKNQSIAAALMTNGIKRLGASRKNVQARGLFCSSGRCCSCYMTVNGEDHVQTCMKRVEEGMEIFPNNEDPQIRSERE
ncbi:(2Fe-2S)-binding protein [Cytobacillus spongiae]|uniref:(2Fe-2S)-binding protein n=1 Tax=Cytobacillus spongiae TaxID=2901381 RepID=UPI001F219AEB|nr:(2Fe-2S)-binding protein [Cytobacillus spongiae]UII55658.1 (2Fe-2S)-binding protein [Cytobacillus spongiae]